MYSTEYTTLHPTVLLYEQKLNVKKNIVFSVEKSRSLKKKIAPSAKIRKLGFSTKIWAMGIMTQIRGNLDKSGHITTLLYTGRMQK